MDQTYCYYCMNPLNGQDVCPVCGTPVGTTGTSEHKTFYLMPGSTLHGGRYLLGRVLGAGGFGITYIGFDTVLQLRVAIKEYFLMNYATRFPTDPKVVMHSTSYAPLFNQGKERFLYEARILASMDKVPVIVGVKDFFEENGTAYIVMEFIQGTTLKELVEQKGGRIPPEELFPLMEPLLRTMVQVHQKGLIHRDIAPDNLMLENGVIRLLDFGCAREAITGTETMTIMLKPGFAPMEQYDGRGQGPWTDIYALCATIYFCLTGEIPPPAIYRFRNDTLKAPSELGVRLLPETERALLQGMAVEPEQRCSSVAELYASISGEFRRWENPEERKRWEAKEAERKRKEAKAAERKRKEAEAAERKRREAEEAKPEQREGQTPWWKRYAVPLGVCACLLAVFLIVSTAVLPRSSHTSYEQNTDTVAQSEEPQQTADTETHDEQDTNTVVQPELPQQTVGTVLPDKKPDLVAQVGTLSKQSLKTAADRYDWEESVESIVFRDTLDGAPDDAEDLSEEKNRSVLGWKNGSTLYLAGEGGVKAPEDCVSLFGGYSENITGDGWLQWKQLTQIQNLQLLDTSEVLDMSYMFHNNREITYLDVSGFDTSRVTNMDCMFGFCLSLSSLDVSGFDTSQVTDISWMFNFCKNLTSLDVSSFNTSQAVRMGSMFSSCESLTSLDVSGFNTSQVTDMSSMFWCCKSLTSLDVSGFDTSQVTDMSSMFFMCKSLTSLDVSGFDTSQVKSMRSMFAFCENLTSLDVSGFDTSQVENMDSIFEGTKWE